MSKVPAAAPPPPPAGGVPPPDASKLTVRKTAAKNAANGKKQRPTSRKITSNVATLRGHKLGNNKEKATEQSIAQQDSEYPVAEIYNVGVYIYNEPGQQWESIDEGCFSRAFVTYNPSTFQYRLLGVRQAESADVGLNTPVPPDLFIARNGRFIQFRDAQKIYLLAFTSRDDAFVFEGILNEVKREQIELAGKRDKKVNCICCGENKALPNCKKVTKAGDRFMVQEDPVDIPIKLPDEAEPHICDACWFNNLRHLGAL